MLLIWDIHITSRYTDTILTALKKFVSSNSDEKNIIFLWDYVYHFSYDRNALMSLYHFFLDLFKEGKNVYVLAGNHDRLGNTFVFEEAKKAFEIIGQLKWDMNHPGKLTFITQPMLEEIEGEKVLFLPYMIHAENVKREMVNGSSPIASVIQTLSESQNKNEKLSAMVNQILLDYISENKSLTVIHHYYINNTKFPGQKSLFHYKDVALHEGFLDMPNIKLISGHLHQAFTFKNYLCAWSVRSTSSLEVNQNKYLWKLSNGVIEVSEVNTNPYVMIEGQDIVDEAWFTKKIEEIREENRKNVTHSEERNIQFKTNEKLNFNSISLSLKVDSVDYEHIEKYVDEGLRMQIKDIKLKKNIQDMGDAMKNFEVSGKNLSTSFADWKEILKEYLHSKYPNNYQKYEDILHDMKLL